MSPSTDTKLSRDSVPPVDNIAEYLATTSEWHEKGLVWFRGHDRKDCDLKPTLYRAESKPYDECELFDEFWALARGLSQLARLSPRDDWDWYLAARHHGLVSRLLDWTTNPLVALYFAVRPLTEAENDSRERRGWALNPYELNQWSCREPSILVPFDGDSDSFVRHWLPKHVVRERKKSFRYDNEDYDNARPIALWPSRVNERIVAQNSFFTIHGSDPTALDASDSANFSLDSVVVRNPVHLRKQLEQVGLHEFAVFADAGALARWLNRTHGFEAKPIAHESCAPRRP